MTKSKSSLTFKIGDLIQVTSEGDDLDGMMGEVTDYRYNHDREPRGYIITRLDGHSAGETEYLSEKDLIPMSALQQLARIEDE